MIYDDRPAWEKDKEADNTYKFPDRNSFRNFRLVNTSVSNLLTWCKREDEKRRQGKLNEWCVNEIKAALYGVRNKWHFLVEHHEQVLYDFTYRPTQEKYNEILKLRANGINDDQPGI